MDKKLEQLKEYAKIIKDTPYALRTYLKTYDNTQQKFVPFDLFPDQLQLVYDYEHYNENITKKYRQAGVSTVTAAWVSKILQTADPQSPQKILVVANKKDTAVELTSKIRNFLTQWPDWINVGFDPSKDSQSWFKLNNGCEVKGVATSNDALRGYTPTCLIFDEAAYIEAGEDFWAACMASLSTGGKVIVISCVVKDTFVFTSSGLQQVNDFIDENKTIGEGYIIDDYNIQGKDKLRTSNLMLNNGKQKTLKIHTVNSMLEGTLTHKVWAFSNKDNKYDWYQLKNLNLGDFICVNYGFELWGNDDLVDFNYTPSSKENNIFKCEKITPDIAYLLGLYISEGSSYEKIVNGNRVGGDITITCGDDVSKTITKLGLKYSSHDNLHYKISSKSFYAFLEYLGFNLSLKAKEKVIPKRLLKLSRENIIALLQGIFDGDGWSDSNRGRIGISMSSKKLIEQLRMLLLNFGILTDYQYINAKPTKKVKVFSDNYRISTNITNTKLFYDIIGFRFKRKQAKSNILDKYNSENTISHDVIPNGGIIIKEIVKNNPGVLKTLPADVKKKYHFINKNKHISRTNFTKIINEIKSICDNNFIEKIYYPNSKWVEIKKIEESENETYDFSLYNDNSDFWCHSIIYNGILGHQTPNGIDSIYYPIYDQALNKLNDFHITDLRWYYDPRYAKDLVWIKCNDMVHYMLNKEDYKGDDLFVYENNRENFQHLFESGYKPYSSWYEKMSKKLKFDRRKIAQEIETTFNGSGDNVIPSDIVDNIKKNMLREPIEKYMSGELWVWKYPIEGHRYIMGLDVSRGDSEDYSAINIIDFDGSEQVLEYIGKIPPDDLATIAYKWGKIYSAFCVIDITGGMGIATSRKMQEFGYKDMYIDGINTKDIWTYDQKILDKIPGINFNNKRTQIIATFEEQLRHNFLIRSERLINEANTFVFINGRPDHMKGCHDDAIMSIAIAMYAGEICFAQLTRNENKNKAMLEAWTMSERSYDPKKSFYSYGTAFDAIGSMSLGGDNRHNNPMNVPKEAYQKYSWLFGKPPA